MAGDLASPGVLNRRSDPVRMAARSDNRGKPSSRVDLALNGVTSVVLIGAAGAGFGRLSSGVPASSCAIFRNISSDGGSVPVRPRSCCALNLNSCSLLPPVLRRCTCAVVGCGIDEAIAGLISSGSPSTNSSTSLADSNVLVLLFTSLFSSTLGEVADGLRGEL